MSHDDDIPLACDLTAAEQIERRRELQERLLRGLREVRELDDGYALRFDWSPAGVQRLGELVALESACCPFLRLTLDLETGNRRVWLSLTGPSGTKALLRRFAPDGWRCGSPRDDPPGEAPPGDSPP